MTELTFIQALLLWIDEEGLVGSSPNPTIRSNGNPQLDTGLACIMEVELNGKNCDIQFLKDRRASVAKCQNKDGSFNKNPSRHDEISHDERLGMAAASKVCGFSFAWDWVKFGINSDWMMSNTNYPYWDANAKWKRWERSAHLAFASLSPGFFGKIFLTLWFICNAKFSDSSGHRLMWAVTRGLKDLGFFPNMGLRYWSKSMTKKYGNVGGLMSAYLYHSYYANTHPFVVFGQKMSF